VRDMAILDEEIVRARSEGERYFGDGRLYVERYVERPRHIEVQVFGDGTDAVHLYERDCSLQRRHQKVIEEAPAPGMTAEVRAAMGSAAVRAAKAIGYAGAGTIEFIVDGSDGLRADRFWFMEMNTRLQVEHPVTEAITGIDLVEWQLRVAAGEPLPMHQADIPLNGHAFEARLYAEDVAAGFLPATGRLAHLAFPDGARADTGVRSGDSISPWYDPMIAKIITHGPTREIALARLARALDTTQVAGTVTNLAFLGALARHAGFSRGEVDTGLIERDIAQLAPLAREDDCDLAMAAMAVLQAAHLPDNPLTGFALWAPLVQQISLKCEGKLVHAQLSFTGPDRVQLAFAEGVIEAQRTADGLKIDGPIRAVVEADGIHVFGLGHSASFQRHDPLDRDAAAGAGSDVTLAPMPGLVRSVEVTAGQQVQQGDPLCILEAMKMEHCLTALRDGVVAEVLITAGNQIEAGAALIRLEPLE